MTEASTGIGRAVAARGPTSLVRAVPRVGAGVRLFLVGADALARAGIRAL
ncbi:hypothetical protein [Streptomyces sp. NPDC002851]